MEREMTQLATPSSSTLSGMKEKDSAKIQGKNPVSLAFARQLETEYS